jgi:hypothetical protein
MTVNFGVEVARTATRTQTGPGQCTDTRTHRPPSPALPSTDPIFDRVVLVSNTRFRTTSSTMGNFLTVLNSQFPPKAKWTIDNVPDLTGKVIHNCEIR